MSPRFTRSVVSVLASCQIRIFYNICFTIYQALYCKQSSCSHALITLIKKPVQLRSYISDLFVVPKVSTNIGAFGVAAPILWNTLNSAVI